MRAFFAVRLLYELRDFLGEVVLALLDAFTLLEADVAVHLDGGAQLLGNVGDVLLDRDLVVLDEGLLQQAYLCLLYTSCMNAPITPKGPTARPFLLRKPGIIV